MNALTTTQPRQGNNQGIFARLRTILTGSRDPIDAQLAEIERQGAAIARLAHGAAYALIVLFSIGSLLGLSHSALITLQHQWQTTHTLDFPSALAAAVNGLLVLVMDTALLLAANMLRIIKARQGEGAGVHIVVMVGVSAIEGATWAYFSWLYDRPTDPIAWALIVARALAAPLLSAYLSLARAIPIGPRDILHQAAMASGKGVIRDVTREANDHSAPLERKIAIYGAAALMHSNDRARLERMIAAVTVQQRPQTHTADTPTTHIQQPAPTRTHDPIAPITQLAAPTSRPSPLPFVGRSDHITPPQNDRPDPPGGQYPVSPGTMPDEDPSRDHRVFTLNLATKRPGAPAGSGSISSPRQPMTREQLRRRRLTVARRILDRHPDIGLRELTRQIAMATSYRISESTAGKIRDELRATTTANTNAITPPDREPDPDPNPAA